MGDCNWKTDNKLLSYCLSTSFPTQRYSRLPTWSRTVALVSHSACRSSSQLGPMTARCMGSTHLRKTAVIRAEPCDTCLNGSSLEKITSFYLQIIGSRLKQRLCKFPAEYGMILSVAFRKIPGQERSCRVNNFIVSQANTPVIVRRRRLSLT